MKKKRGFAMWTSKSGEAGSSMANTWSCVAARQVKKKLKKDGEHLVADRQVKGNEATVRGAIEGEPWSPASMPHSQADTQVPP